MKFPRIELPLQNSPDRVRQAILAGELDPYCRKSNRFTTGRVARKIRWSRLPDGSLQGKVSYFTNMDLSVMRFRIELVPSSNGAKAILTAHHGPFSPFLLILLYLIGLCMFVVGILFSYFAQKMIESKIRRAVTAFGEYLKMWDVEHHEILREVV